MQTNFNTYARWIRTPQHLQQQKPFLIGLPLKLLNNNQALYEVKINSGKKQIILSINDTFQMSTQNKTYEDMCNMNILNEPQILNNLISRYMNSKICTFIGPTLIILNPYKFLPQYFDKKVLLKMRQKILKQNIQNDEPHVYTIAGRAFLNLRKTTNKQAIVISGQSGAGKTQSTKYCLEMLTSLSHMNSSNSIESNILTCNPLLQAFGNSKTVRNDNSSRFGKYIQIYFGADNTIKGAKILSYLLQKSRVVSISKGQRTFHAFYALIASNMFNLKAANQYQFLKNSDCYTANNINDNQFFKEINQSMIQIGFKQKQQLKIWLLLKTILELGNIQFDDSTNTQNEQYPCTIDNEEILQSISEILQISKQNLIKILLFEKKNYLGEIIYKPYKKNECIGNRNTLCRAIYNSIFEFILYKVQLSLNPKQSTNLKTISILDIFGFQNFQHNSFEQLCINFSNQRLLKLYNEYIFKRQMQILIQDGLLQQVKAIKPPKNDQVINIICNPNSKFLSIFSIINDITSQQQFTDQNIKESIQNKIKKTTILKFQQKKNKRLNFMIRHSQGQVQYDLTGFKIKNMDNVNSQIQQLIDGFKVINSGKKHKEQKNKTLLKKFSGQIQHLINQLSSSNVHFIRCIKPNNEKKQLFSDHKYILSQMRYLGVFQTIQIRKKMFPIRKNYVDFVQDYRVIFPQMKITNNSNDRQIAELIIKQLKSQNDQYMFGSKRVYVNQKINSILSKKLFQFLKIRNQLATKVQKVCKRFIFTSKVSRNLKIIVQRKRILMVMSQNLRKKFLKLGFRSISQNYKNFKLRQIQSEQKNKQKVLKKKKLQNELKSMQNRALLQSEKNQKLDKVQDPYQTIAVESPEKKNSEKLYIKKKIDNCQSIKNKQNNFNQSFYHEQSVYISPGAESIFAGNLKLPIFVKNKQTMQDLQLLKSILSKKYQPQISIQNDSFSSDNSFDLQDYPPELAQRIIQFPIQDFFLHVLRKRKGLFGLRKRYQDILTFKPKSLTRSLTDLDDEEEQKALSIFKLLVKIGEQTDLENVFKQVDIIMRECQQTSESFKNQIFLQLIKQSNNKVQVPAIRIYQTFSVFIHIYTPDEDFLYAALCIFLKKMNNKHIRGKEQEFIKYLCKKMIIKLQRPYSIGYMPIKYQLMALMSKKYISIPIYFPIGNNIILKVQPYETFRDIKIKALTLFGINTTRIPSDFFTFFYILNYQNTELQQCPIKQTDIVWDTMTYWQLVKQNYQQAGKSTPYFFFMIKIKYTFQCSIDDPQTIQIFFAQCYFDYSMGRIRLELKQMAMLAACIKKVKLGKKNAQDVEGCFPLWIIKICQKNIFKKLILDNITWLQQYNFEETAIKYKFLQICSESPLTMSFAVPTQGVLKLFLKPKKIYVVEKGTIIAQFSIRQIAKWSHNDESFNFCIRKNGVVQGRTHMIMTEYASMCTDYLNKLSQYIIKFGGRKKKQQIGKFLDQI